MLWFVFVLPSDRHLLWIEQEVRETTTSHHWFGRRIRFPQFGTSHDSLLGIQEIPVLVLTVHSLQPTTIGSIRVDSVSKSRADVFKGAGLPLFYERSISQIDYIVESLTFLVNAL